MIENNIETTEQLISFKKNTEKNISDLVLQRGKLYDKNSSKAEIKTINSKLQKLRKDVQVCNNIFADSERIKECTKYVYRLEKEANELQKQRIVKNRFI